MAVSTTPGMARPARPDTQRLLSLARQFHVRGPADAAGRCLSASLDFAHAASLQLGVELRLVKWSVRGDPDYVDHWAVEFGATKVIDLTRAQVDGRRQLVHSLDAYPPHYTDRRVYAASLLLPAYLEAGASGAARLSNGFLWHCGTTLLRNDLRRALRERDAGLALAALREALTFVDCFAVSALTRALQARAETLLGALHGRPEIAARASAPKTEQRRRATDRVRPLARAPARLQHVAARLAPAANAHCYSLCSVILACA